MNTKSVFATRLKALREKEGLSQAKLGEAIGASRGSISFYEKGERAADIEILYRLSKYFHVSSDYLLGISDSDKIKQYFDELNGKKIEINTLDLDLYSKINECFLNFQTLYYNKYGLENDGARDEFVPQMTKIIYNHIKDIVETYDDLCEDLSIDKGEKALPKYLACMQSSDCYSQVAEEILRLDGNL